MDHEVSATLATKVLTRKDLVITIKGDGQKLGDLLISKGNIEWLPSGHFVNRWTMPWTKFAGLMREHGTQRRISKTKP